MRDKAPLKLGVLVSGNGTNLQAIIDSIEAGGLNASICCVISNSADAFALTRAKNHGIPAILHENSGFVNRREYDAATVGILHGYGVELVILAGYMRILSDAMINAFPDAIMNIHPAMLPAFPGLHAQRQALDYGVRYSGCTVHFVDCGTDTGPIIMQAVVPVEHDDTEESLSVRIQKIEHRLLPAAIKLYADGRIKVEGHHVRVLADVEII